MRVGLIGLGRMGEGMSRRMMKAGIEVWGYRRNYEKANEAFENGFVNGITTDIESLVKVVKQNKNGRVQPGIFQMVVPAETGCAPALQPQVPLTIQPLQHLR